MRTLLILLALTLGCAEKLPDRLALDPGGPFKMQKVGQSEELKVAAFTGKMPYVKAVPASWETRDANVVTVDDKGIVKATGSGKTQVTATAWGLTTSADFTVVIVGSVEVKDDVPKPFKLNAKPHQLTVTVKDDKGNVIDKPLVRYKATNYCVEVTDDGLLSPLADGECDVVIESADKKTKIHVDTKS